MSGALVAVIKFGAAGVLLYALFKVLEKISRREENQCSYSPSNFTGDDITICSICLEHLSAKETVQISCKHKFHRVCLGSVFQHMINKNCPICRAKIKILNN